MEQVPQDNETRYAHSLPLRIAAGGLAAILLTVGLANEAFSVLHLVNHETALAGQEAVQGAAPLFVGAIALNAATRKEEVG
jgi:hypothetical protein